MKQLEEMLNAGKTAPEIGKELKRTPQAIYARVQRIYRKRPIGGSARGFGYQWGLKAKK